MPGQGEPAPVVIRRERLAQAAARLVGTPFRLHGRDPRFGLDCVGLVLASLDAIGECPRFSAQYRLRNTTIEHLLPQAGLYGLAAAQGAVKPGDILLVRPGPGQHHLLVAQDRSHFIHAHAGLKRVVRTPGPLPWPIEQGWHLAQMDSD